MFNWESAKQDTLDFWANQPTDQVGSINSFAGTWDIQDHDLIPNALMNFLSEKFYSTTRFRRVPLADINDALNEVWEGPGSMTKIVELTYQMKLERHANNKRDIDPLKGYESPTVDSDLDYDTVKLVVTD